MPGVAGSFTRPSYSWARLVLVLVAGACSSLPPTTPVTSVSQVAGTWRGTGRGPQGAVVTVTTMIEPDGSYSAVIGPQTFTGKITLEAGTLHGRSNQTDSAGTWSLREGEGRRVLVYTSDDGRISAALTPVP